MSRNEKENGTWMDWKWQIANRISRLEQLQPYVELSEIEREAFTGEVPLSFAVTPFFMEIVQKSAALRKTVIPTQYEIHTGEAELEDPLGEEEHRVSPHLIHTYPDKVLFLVTTFCSTYCRYCTRSRMVGKPEGGRSAYEDSFLYIENHPEIRDVLLSGGDPLTMSDGLLDEILTRLRTIPHVRTVRIGSKVPVVLPMRITDALCAVLRKHRVWLSLHFIHADELTDETRRACRRLSDHGIAMVSQTVLLKGVNDDTQSLIDLFYGLLEINVKPYYLLQCDPIQGSEHFRTKVERGIELIQSLHGRISGVAIPQYVIDAPGGGGKVPILSLKQIEVKQGVVEFSNCEMKKFQYPNG